MWQKEVPQNGLKTLKRQNLANGSFSTVTIAEINQKINHLTTKGKKDIFALLSVTQNIVKNYYRNTNTTHGREESLKQPKLVVETRSIKSGSERYLREMGNVYGVALLKNSKPTTSKDGAPMLSYALKLPTVELSV